MSHGQISNDREGHDFSRAVESSTRASAPGAGFHWQRRLFQRFAADTHGAAILEFAISLPLLVVFVVGIYDFSGAFNQKQKIAQAAQEAAIIAGAQPMSDIWATNANPASLQAVSTAVYNSLVGSGVIPSGACTPPGTVSGPAGLTWTYKIKNCNSAQSTDDLIITINRGFKAGTGPPVSIATVVTVQYSYYWQFNRVIQLLFPGAGYQPSTALIEAASVHNQT